MTLSDSAKYLVNELKQENYLNELFKQSTIDFNNYFKYSGKTEEYSKEMKQYIKNEEAFNKVVVDFKRIEKYEQVIKEERAENYKKYTKQKRKWTIKKKTG
tara:strand:+ start:1372 stop:1674 length:303 start_codon:yes stop_codon:yes gene_type:complete